MNIELEEKEYEHSREFGIACATIIVTPEPNDEHCYNGNMFYSWPVCAFSAAFANAIDFEALGEWNDNEGNTWEHGETNVYGNDYATLMFAYEDNSDIVEIELCPEDIQKIRKGKPFIMRGSISI